MTSRFSDVSTSDSRSHSLDLSSYDTDKVPNGFLEFYDSIFSPHHQEEIALLELGVLNGGALQLWHDYFPQGQVIGIDRQLKVAFPEQDRIHVVGGEQDDPKVLDLAAAKAPGGLNFIIDDASHEAAPTRTAFWHLFLHHLKPGGWYIIEDWGTGYWENWPDGKSYQTGKNHLAGMVGFVKSLVDEVGAHDHSRNWYDQSWTRDSRFAEVRFLPSIVAIRKK